MTKVAPVAPVSIYVFFSGENQDVNRVLANLLPPTDEPVALQDSRFINRLMEIDINSQEWLDTLTEVQFAPSKEPNTPGQPRPPQGEPQTDDDDSSQLK